MWLSPSFPGLLLPVILLTTTECLKFLGKILAFPECSSDTKAESEQSREKATNLVKSPPFHVYCHRASRGLGGCCGAGGCWVVCTVQDPGDQHTPSLTSSLTRQPPHRRAHLLFCHFSCCWLLHCSYATPWSNYMQIKNIFFFKTMLK